MRTVGTECDGVQRLPRAGKPHSRHVCGRLPRNEDPTMDATPTPGPRRTARRLALACGIAAYAATAWLSAAADTEVYKWVDPQGRIHYSDRPPPSEGRLLSMESTPSARAHVAAQLPPSGASSAPRANTPPPPSGAPSPRMREAVDSDVANAHAEQCKAAQ